MAAAEHYEDTLCFWLQWRHHKLCTGQDQSKKSLKWFTILITQVWLNNGSSDRMTEYEEWLLGTLNEHDTFLYWYLQRQTLLFYVLGSNCWGREDVPGAGGRSWKVQRSSAEVWEVVWAASGGKASHILLMQLLERQSALPGLALPQHKLPLLLFIPARIWG